jgi:hypothetical protein
MLESSGENLAPMDFGLRASGSAPRANRFELRIERFRTLRVGAKEGASQFRMSLVPFR